MKTGSSSSSSSKQKDSGAIETEEDDEKSGGGRGGVLIKSIEAGSKNRQIMFSERRDVLLRKAWELATLCDSEVGLIIFACTGQLYEYSSTSMKEVIERYINNQKGDEQLPVDGPSDIKMLQDKVASLKLQVQDLQENNRRLMGETSGMSINNLQNLEDQLELSLSAVRLQKDQLRSDHIDELHVKRSRVCQENMELKERIHQIDKEKAELSEKFYNEESLSGGADHVCQSIDNRYQLNLQMQYLYSMPPPPGQDDNNIDQNPVTTELGLTLPRSGSMRIEDD